MSDDYRADIMHVEPYESSDLGAMLIERPLCPHRRFGSCNERMLIYRTPFISPGPPSFYCPQHGDGGMVTVIEDTDQALASWPVRWLRVVFESDLSADPEEEAR